MDALGRRLLPTILGLAFLALALAPTAPLAKAASHAEFTVNIIDAESHGCSPDSWTQPDLRVRVYVDNVLLMETDKAQDQARPLFARAARHNGPLPAVLSIEVDEAEPGGAFGLGTSWVRCQIGPDGGTRINFTYEGDAERVIVATGAGTRAAQATLVVGTAAPPMPAASAMDITASSARLSWNAATGATAHHVGASGAAPTFATVGGDATGFALTDLCDNGHYTVRVIREQGAWRLGELVTFTTTNIAPPPARILSAARAGDRVDVSWEAPQHDVDKFEVHMGATPTFTPDESTLRDERGPSGFTPHESRRIQTQANDGYARILTRDLGGLQSVSPAFAFDATPVEEVGVPRCGLGDAGAGASNPSSLPPFRTVETAQPIIQVPEQDDSDGATRLSTTDPHVGPPTDVDPMSFLTLAIGIVVGILIAVVFVIVRK